jgi:sec-independent protein translocase protein TatB
VPDIGFGEIVVIVVIALLVFGPDRLPKVAADAARLLRQVRVMAASARKDLVDAAGLEDDGEMAQTVRDLRDLDPRRAMQGVLSDDPAPSGPAGRPGPGPRGSSTAGPAPAASPAGGTAAASGAGSTPGSQPVAPPVVAPAQADPDWT